MTSKEEKFTEEFNAWGETYFNFLKEKNENGRYPTERSGKQEVT